MLKGRGSWKLLGFCVCIFLIPAFIGQWNLTKRPFDPAPKEKLARTKPDLLFIGDSMLETRIDEKYLEKISGIQLERMPYPGTGTACWWLILKNYVAPLDRPPKTVVVFFRDMQLTLTDYHTTGRYRPRLEALMQNSGEPFLEKVLQADGNEKIGALNLLAARLYPLQKHQLEWQEKIYTKALTFTTAPGERADVREESNRIFSARRLRADAGGYAEGEEDNMSGLAPSGHAFQTMLPLSLLPSLLDLARTKNIHLVFFRVKRKPRDDERPYADPEYLQPYMDALKGYLQKAGATYLDETQDAEIRRGFYGADDHLLEDHMKDYTRIFWEKYRADLVGPGEGATTR